LDTTICLSCLPECNVEEGTKLSGHNVYPLGAETQEECSVACLREPECHFWTHNPNIGRCWLKKSDLGKGPSSKGSNSGQKSCGVTEDDILSGRVIEDGCDCTSETTEACLLEENTKYSGHNLYTTKGRKVGNRAGCASLCFGDSKCKFWTYNPRVSKCWMKTSDQGRSPSSKGSISGQKACGAPGALPEEPETLPTRGEMASPNFPRNYANNLHERKTIEVAKGNVINIHFSDFELERARAPDGSPSPAVDYVEITDGDGTLLGRFGGEFYADEGDSGSRSGEGSGEEEPERNRIRISDITSVTETVHVLFHTDRSDTYRGWRLEWSSSPSPSSEEELARTGVLTSLNFPKGYSSNIDQVQKIQAPEGNNIRIRFTDFECEREFDTVTITDKDGTRLALFDGGANSDDEWRKEIVSNTDTVEVLFHTDGSVVHKGWRLDWSCEDPLNPEVVGETENVSNAPPSSVLILGDEDAPGDRLESESYNYWLARWGETTGQGFTVKVDSRARWIAGFQMKNIGKEAGSLGRSTKAFKVSGSKNEHGPWQTLVEDELADTSGDFTSAPLLNFTFEHPVEVQYLRFDLISFWKNAGGLQYFAPILATGWLVGDEWLPKSGVLKSPNYPSPYPSSLDNTDTIQVAEGKKIRFKWTDMYTEPKYDYVQAVDGDGTELTSEISGNYYGNGNAENYEGRFVESNSNIVHIKFHTDGSEQRTGWRLEWDELL